MKKYLFVVLLLLGNGIAQAMNMADAIDSIEKEWALTYYSSNARNPSATYQKLLLKTQALAKEFPTKAEPLLWQAILNATDANHQSPITALEQVSQARDLLIQAIEIDPKGINGSAHVTLATLYYMTPPWPIAFGDNDKAEELFRSALAINPDSIEANYFYGDYLLNLHRLEQAQLYFQKALAIPARKHQLLEDNSLHQQAELALNSLSDPNGSESKKLFVSLTTNTSKTVKNP